MTLRLTFDESNWIELPAEFPTADAADAGEWLDSVVSRMRDSWPEGLDRTAESAVRDVLVRGLASVRSGDAATLQYWPWFAPVAAVLHLVDGQFEDGDERPAYLLGSGPMVAEPAIDVVTAEILGQGVEVRMMTRPDGVIADVAGLTQLYVSGDRFVGVGVDATVPLVLLAMLPDLRELMNTVAVVDEAGVEPWVRAEVGEGVLPGPGELWPVEAQEPTPA